MARDLAREARQFRPRVVLPQRLDGGNIGIGHRGVAAPASRLSAAARAAPVIFAPDSIRAISSRRASGGRASALVSRDRERCA